MVNRKLAGLLISAMLIVSLVACGRTDTKQDSEHSGTQDTTQSDSATNQGETTPDHSGSAIVGNDDSQENSGTVENPAENGVNDIVNDMDDAIDDITGEHSAAQRSGISYSKMLENGRVKG